jgi:hypothetical protein
VDVKSRLVVMRSGNSPAAVSPRTVGSAVSPRASAVSPRLEGAGNKLLSGTINLGKKQHERWFVLGRAELMVRRARLTCTRCALLQCQEKNLEGLSASSFSRRPSLLRSAFAWRGLFK